MGQVKDVPLDLNPQGMTAPSLFHIKERHIIQRISCHSLKRVLTEWMNDNFFLFSFPLLLITSVVTLAKNISSSKRCVEGLNNSKSLLSMIAWNSNSTWCASHIVYIILYWIMVASVLYYIALYFKNCNISFNITFARCCTCTWYPCF